MRKLTFLLTCLFLVGVGLVNAQTKSISGKVLSAEDGQPIIGATIKVKGTTAGTITNVDGEFKISLQGDAKNLVVSYVGMTTAEVQAVNGMTVKLQSDAKMIDEVVVTAIGIKRSQKALGYSATAISSADLTATGNRSALNALQGKVAGVEISSGSGAPGASTRVVMRGATSLGGSNQPLYIIDGVPVSNGQVGGSNSINGGLDFGNRANDINPDDVESMTILKGGSATALYGSRAASGVIIITTKNGSKANNKARVDISSTTTFESPLRLPVMQNEFGQGWYDRGGGAADLMENGSWGPRFDGKTRIWGFAVDNQQQIKPYVALKDNIKDFFDTGISTNNTVAISNGDENKSYYMSFGNISSDGIMPTNADSYKRNNVSLRGSSKFLKIFTGSGSLNYVRKDSKFAETGQQQAALDGLWQSARDISVVDQKDYNNKFNNVDNYFTIFAQNPYYLLNEHGNKFLENRIFGNLSLDAKVLPWLTATFKAGGDAANSTLKKWRAITNSSRSDSNDEVGRVSEDSYYNSEINTDFYLTINKDFSKDFTFSGIVGHNFNQRDTRNQGTEVIGLDIPKFYNLSNSSATPNVYGASSSRRLVGVYGSLDFGYKSMLYLNVSARNDWSSTLPASNRSFFYPSVSTSFIFSELIENKDILSFGKIRVGVARTGKDADPYQISAVLGQTTLTDGYRNLNFPLAGSVNGFSVANLIGNDKLQPEISTDKEIGVDLKFFKNRIGLDVSLYDKTVTDLIWTVTIPSTTGFTAQTQNLGKITNKGIEVSLTLVPIKTKDFEWEISANFSKNKNLLVELAPGLDQISLGGTSSIDYVARPGYELGLYVGNVVATNDKGKTIVNSLGLPTFKDTKEVLGSSQNKYRIGGTTSLTYKGFRLHASIDFRKGGLMYSRTAEMMYFTGNAPQTTYNDRQPFIIPNSVQKLSNGDYVENTVAIAGFSSTMSKYYDQTYNAGQGAAYVLVDKTFFKLRELSLSYSLPKSLLAKTFVNSVDLALVGTNLFLWTPNSNLFTDPEMSTFGGTSSTNKSGSSSSADIGSDFGDYGGTPSTRSVGFSVKLGF
jgi:TonB-linked SusC/RagA family outer membrane protein